MTDKCLRLLLFLLLFPIYLHAQEEKKITDDIADAVRHTGQKISNKVKDFNGIDTTYISPNLYNLAKEAGYTVKVEERIHRVLIFSKWEE